MLDPAQRARSHASLFGYANRFALFLHHAIEHTEAGGFVGAVVPTSFLGGGYYKRLRALIAERAPLARLVFVTERAGVFASGVLQAVRAELAALRAQRAPRGKHARAQRRRRQARVVRSGDLVHRARDARVVVVSGSWAARLSR